MFMKRVARTPGGWQSPHAHQQAYRRYRLIWKTESEGKSKGLGGRIGFWGLGFIGRGVIFERDKMTILISISMISHRSQFLFGLFRYPCRGIISRVLVHIFSIADKQKSCQRPFYPGGSGVRGHPVILTNSRLNSGVTPLTPSRPRDLASTTW